MTSGQLKDCITDRLEVVSITLEDDDDPYKIFESINFTGIPLKASDIIRNFVFMNIRDWEEQSAIYDNHWYPMESLLGTDIDRFFWRYLDVEGRHQSNNPRAVFDGIKGLLGSDNHGAVVDMTQRFHRFSRFWAQLKGTDTMGLSPLVVEEIRRLNQIQTDLVYPFLMRALNQMVRGTINESELLEVMKFLESSIVRKAVCDDTRRMDNLYQITLAVDYHEFVTSVRNILLSNNWNWPDDEWFSEEFITAQQYSEQSATQRRTRLILEALETSYGHKESPPFTSDITIEHIMPQDPSEDWQFSLGVNWHEDHSTWVHTIGNLTLTGYNPELSNKPFAEKKAILSKSNFALNESLQTYDDWNADTIQQRGRELAERAVKIWPR